MTLKRRLNDQDVKVVKIMDNSTDSIRLSTHGTCGTKKGALESEVPTKTVGDRTPNAARDSTSM